MSLILEFRLLITIVFAKSLRKAGENMRALTQLQLEYSKAPHFTSLLYLYGKFAITSGLHEFMGSAIGALDECLRQCLPHRHQNIKVIVSLKHHICSTILDWHIRQ
jgi:hypothetical protein